MPYDSDEAVPPQLIDAALERVLASRGFRGSARKRRFLQFIVQQTQAGLVDRIKAYTIAVDVFDRDASFDPLLDPVVRIQAGRIRHCLEQYYLTEGASDPIRITIPKGSYVPHFAWMPGAGCDTSGGDVPVVEPRRSGHANGPDGDAAEPADASVAGLLPVPVSTAIGGLLGGAKPRLVVAAGALLLAMSMLALLAAWGISSSPSRVQEMPMVALRTTEQAPTAQRMTTAYGPSLLVLPFTNGAGVPAQDTFVEGFTEDLIGALIRFRNMLVFGADTSFRYRSVSALHEAEPAIDIDYVLKGSIGQIDGQVEVTVTLIGARDGRYLWSDSFRRDLTAATVIELRRDIAVQIARALAQPQGVIYSQETRGSAERSPTALSSYECVLRTRQYWRRLSTTLHAEVRTCLERAVRADPMYADAWAALAMVTIDEARLGFNPTPDRPDPVGTGLELATRAVAIAPNTPLPLQALGLAYWLRREPQLSIAAYEQALALNPNDSDILADLGRCYSLVGAWERGIPLIREAFARNPAQPNWYRIVLALFHYVHGRYGEALIEAKRINVPESVLPHIALAMIHGQAGHPAEGAAEVKEILRIDPRYGEKVVADLERRNIAPATINRIIDGLRKAGLPVTSRWGFDEGQ